MIVTSAVRCGDCHSAYPGNPLAGLEYLESGADCIINREAFDMRAFVIRYTGAFKLRASVFRRSRCNGKSELDFNAGGNYRIEAP